MHLRGEVGARVRAHVWRRGGDDGGEEGEEEGSEQGKERHDINNSRGL